MGATDMSIATLDEHSAQGKSMFEGHAKTFDHPVFGPIVCKIVPRSNSYGGVPSFPSYFRVCDTPIAAQALDAFLGVCSSTQRQIMTKLINARAYSAGDRGKVMLECVRLAAKEVSASC